MDQQQRPAAKVWLWSKLWRIVRAPLGGTISAFSHRIWSTTWVESTCLSATLSCLSSRRDCNSTRERIIKKIIRMPLGMIWRMWWRLVMWMGHSFHRWIIWNIRRDTMLTILKSIQTSMSLSLNRTPPRKTIKTTANNLSLTTQKTSLKLPYPSNSDIRRKMKKMCWL